MESKKALSRIALAALIFLTWTAYSGLNAKYLNPVNYTDKITQLPFTSRQFMLGLYEMVHAHPLLERALVAFYIFGFSTTYLLALIVFLWRREYEHADAILLGYLFMQTVAGIIYAFAYVDPPHAVFGVNPTASNYMNLANNRFVLPSLHTAITVFLAIYFAKNEKSVWKWYFIASGILTPITTVVLIQHWVYDALAGIALAGAGYIFVSKSAGGVTRILESMARYGDVEKWAATALMLAVVVLLVKIYWPELPSQLVSAALLGRK